MYKALAIAAGIVIAGITPQAMAQNTQTDLAGKICAGTWDTGSPTTYLGANKGTAIAEFYSAAGKLTARTYSVFGETGFGVSAQLAGYARQHGGLPAKIGYATHGVALSIEIVGSSLVIRTGHGAVWSLTYSVNANNPEGVLTGTLNPRGVAGMSMAQIVTVDMPCYRQRSA